MKQHAPRSDTPWHTCVPSACHATVLNSWCPCLANRSSSSQIQIAENRVKQLESELRKLRTDEHSSTKKLDTALAENAELRDAVTKAALSERQKKELVALRQQHGALQHDFGEFVASNATADLRGTSCRS